MPPTLRSSAASSVMSSPAPDPAVLIWIHGDSLSPEDPAARRHPGAPRVFVFDRPLLQSARLSFKRLFFLYECAGEAADEIRLGDPVEELLEACRIRGCTSIATTVTHAPRFHDLVRELRARIHVQLVPAPEFVPVPPDFIPRRFTAFWRTCGGEWVG